MGDGKATAAPDDGRRAGAGARTPKAGDVVERSDGARGRVGTAGLWLRIDWEWEFGVWTEFYPAWELAELVAVGKVALVV